MTMTGIQERNRSKSPLAMAGASWSTALVLPSELPSRSTTRPRMPGAKASTSTIASSEASTGLGAPGGGGGTRSRRRDDGRHPPSGPTWVGGGGTGGGPGSTQPGGDPLPGSVHAGPEPFGGGAQRDGGAG